MYNAFFEFEKNPFATSPDLDFFYRSQQHDASLRSLTFAVQARMGLSSLIGEQGTGKTMVLEGLRDSLEATQIHCAFLRDSRVSAPRFFQTIASELELKCQGTSAYQVFAALHQYTLQQLKKGRTVALIIDAAHNLSADVLNEILHLASLHDDKTKLLQTVLAGRPELHNTLDALNLERLQQHAILGCHLDPFTAEDTQHYIEFRLAQAGMHEQKVFPPQAVAEIYKRSRGFAPAIHAICEGLLLAAFSAHSKVCTPEILDLVFRKPRGAQPEHIEITPTLVAVTRIDLAHLIAPAEPEPPALLTTLLHLTFAVLPSFPPPLPLKGSEVWQVEQVTLQTMFPAGKFAIPVKDFPVGSQEPIQLGFNAGTKVPPPLPASPHELLEALPIVLPAVRPTPGFRLPSVALAAGSKKRMRLGKGKAASKIDHRIDPVPAAVLLSMPVASKPVVNAEPRAEDKLQHLRPYSAVQVSATSFPPAGAIDFPGMALQPALSAIERLAASSAVLMPKGVNKLARLSSTVTPHAGIPGLKVAAESALSAPASPGTVHPVANLQPIGEERVSLVPLPTWPEPPAAATELRNIAPTEIEFPETHLSHPTAAASEALKSAAPRIRESDLISVECDLNPRPAAMGSPAGADSFSVPGAPALQPMHPAAKLEPAGIIRRPHVPLTPFGIAKSDPPPVRTSSDVQFESANLGNPAKPAIPVELTIAREPNVGERDHLVSLTCNVSPVAPRAESPNNPFLNALPSLKPYRPVAKLEPVDPGLRSPFYQCRRRKPPNASLFP